MKTNFLFLLFVLFCLVPGAQAQWLIQNPGLANAAPINSVSAIDANTAWAITNHSSSTSAPHTVVRTIDGGNTWTTFPLKTTSPLTSIVPGSFNVGQFTATDANTAWFLAMDSAPLGQIRVYKTSNGGQNWTFQVLNTSSSRPNLIHFFDANTGVIFCDIPNAGFEIYRTTDGGGSWTKLPQSNLPPPAGIQDEGSKIYTTLGNTIWVAVRSWRIYKSTDKGLTWTVSPPAMGAMGGPLNFMALAFTDANNGLASYRGDLLKTTDGGDTWSPLTHTGTLHKSYIRAIPGSPGAYISAGSYYRPWHAMTPTDDRGSSFSFDHGNTWVSLGDTIAHTDIAFLNSTTGWTGGIDGTMHKFTGSPLAISKGSVAANQFTISPNPSTGIFTISGQANQSFRAEVYTITGLMIAQQQSHPFGPTRLNLTAQPKGIYLLRIYSQGQVFIRRIVLN